MSLRRPQGCKIKTADAKSCVQKWAGLKDQEKLNLPEGVCCCEMSPTCQWPLEMTASRTRMSKWWHMEEGKEIRGIFYLFWEWGSSVEVQHAGFVYYMHSWSVLTQESENHPPGLWLCCIFSVLMEPSTDNQGLSEDFRQAQNSSRPDVKYGLWFPQYKMLEAQEKVKHQSPTPASASVQLTICHVFWRLSRRGVHSSTQSHSCLCQSSLPVCKRNTGSHFHLHRNRKSLLHTPRKS